MKRKAILQYLSTTSDTFLVVAFGALLVLPLALSIGLQPVKDISKNDALAAVQQKIAANRADLTQVESPVLGVTDDKSNSVETVVQSALQNVDVKLASSPDTKKIVLDKSSSSTTESSISGNIKVANTSFDLMTLTNKNNYSLNFNLDLSILDTKNTQYELKVGNEKYSLTKETNKSLALMLKPNVPVTISITAKQAGSFKLTAKVV
jgi:hypothetical protein